MRSSIKPAVGLFLGAVILTSTGCDLLQKATGNDSGAVGALVLNDDVKEYIDNENKKRAANSCSEVPKLLKKIEELEDKLAKQEQDRETRRKQREERQRQEADQPSRAEQRREHAERLQQLREVESARLRQEIVQACLAEAAKPAGASAAPSTAAPTVGPAAPAQGSKK